VIGALGDALSVSDEAPSTASAPTFGPRSVPATPPLSVPSAQGFASMPSLSGGGPDFDVVGLLAGAVPAGVAATSSLPSGIPPWLANAQAADVDKLSQLPAVGNNAMFGDQRAIETLSRGFARRDPVAGFDPLPLGRDSATYTTAALSTKHEPGQHWPELVAFRASDDFPNDDQHPRPERPDNIPASAEHLPTWASRRVSDVPAAVLWPNAPPTSRGGTKPRPAPMLFDTLGSGVAPRLGKAQQPPTTGTPPWLNAPSATPEAPRSRGVPSAARGPGLDGVRRDFPILEQSVNGQRLIWLDSGATTQKPRAVIDAVSNFYERDNSNVHRGAHTLAARATDAYEGAREKVQRYLGAGSKDEIVFVRGATEAINLVAKSWGRDNLKAGDEILVTHLEHHANIVPWQQIAEERGALLRPIPVDDNGDVRLDAYESMLSPRVKMVAMSQVSNALGTVVPVGPMSMLAHQHGARVLVDGAQSVAHLPVDVKCLGADFFVFSGHKIYGPTGIGVLWAQKEVLESMSPWQGGGGMIRDVTFERTIYASPPAKFEAGTPNLAGAVGLGAALDYVESLGRPQIAAWEHMLIEQMVAGLRTVPGLRIIGEPMMRAAAVSFIMDHHSPEEVAKHLDRRGIAVRAGHHCAQPILRRFGLEQTVRASVGVYNVPEDIERLVAALRALPSGARQDGHGVQSVLATS